MSDLKAPSHPTDIELYDAALDAPRPGVLEHVDSCATCRDLFEVLRRVALARAEKSSAHGGLRLDFLPSAADCEVDEDAVAQLFRSDEAKERAAELIEAAEKGDDELAHALGGLRASPVFHTALLFACQDASRLAAHAPERSLALAAAVAKEAAALPSAKARTLFSRPLLEGEAALLEAQAHLCRQDAERSRDTVRRARGRFALASADTAFDEARCDYFEASALLFLDQVETAISLLERALVVFNAEGEALAHCAGRVESVLGLAFLQQQAHENALPHFLAAEAALDPTEDASAFTANAINHGLALAGLGRFREAREKQALALRSAVRHRLALKALEARGNLAELDLYEGQAERAAAGFEKTLASSKRANLPHRFTYSALYLAECYILLGRPAAATALLVELSGDGGIAGAEAAISEVRSFAEKGDVTEALVRHVRGHLERLLGGEAVSYRSFQAG